MVMLSGGDGKTQSQAISENVECHVKSKTMLEARFSLKAAEHRKMIGECVKIGVCISPPFGCGGIAKCFRDALSVKEYKIGGMCQKCQNFVFGGYNAFCMHPIYKFPVGQSVTLHVNMSPATREWHLQQGTYIHLLTNVDVWSQVALLLLP